MLPNNGGAATFVPLYTGLAEPEYLSPAKAVRLNCTETSGIPLHT